MNGGSLSPRKITSFYLKLYWSWVRHFGGNVKFVRIKKSQRWLTFLPKTQLNDALIESCTALSNHLGRPIEDLGRNRDAELLGRFEIDNQLELGRLLDGEIRRFCSSQDLVHVHSRATK